MSRLGKFLRLTSSDRLLFVEAAIWLGVARVALRVMPFRWIARFLGKHMAESPDRISLVKKDIVERVSWGVRTASRHMPWECKCLAQAIAGKGMFNLRGVRSTLYLGVAKDDGEKLRAHAWLRSGDVFVTGGHRTNQFVVVSSFREHKR